MRNEREHCLKRGDSSIGRENRLGNWRRGAIDERGVGDEAAGLAEDGCL